MSNWGTPTYISSMDGCLTNHFSIIPRNSVLGLLLRQINDKSNTVSRFLCSPYVCHPILSYILREYITLPLSSTHYILPSLPSLAQYIRVYFLWLINKTGFSRKIVSQKQKLWLKVRFVEVERGVRLLWVHLLIPPRPLHALHYIRQSKAKQGKVSDRVLKFTDRVYLNSKLGGVHTYLHTY